MSVDRDALVAALEAERLRPVPPPRRFRPDPRRKAPSEQLAELLAEVAQADGRTRAVRGPADGRREDYEFLRLHNVPIEEAAMRVGIGVEQARAVYEPLIESSPPVDNPPRSVERPSDHRL